MKVCTGCGGEYEDERTVCPWCKKEERSGEIVIEQRDWRSWGTAGRAAQAPQADAKEPSACLRFSRCSYGGQAGYCVDGFSGLPESRLVIPDSYRGQTVFAVGPKAFRGRKTIQSLQLPSGLVRIGASAFEECSSLHTITGGDGVKVLEEHAFRGCFKLRSADALLGARAGEVENTFAGCYQLPLTAEE